ncbi:calcium-translocating P-type ATPase, SERCA-type [Candidatus Woesearchaeota archaeon]|nr:calcium-translocating P-type ATPase, SERCA-type [Candidatus Woesearchaeota archaeon]
MKSKKENKENKKTYYDKEIKEVLKELDTEEEGLSSSEAKKRLEKYGRNKLKEEKGISGFKIFIEQFKSPLIWVLIAAMLISIAVAFIEKENGLRVKDLTDAIVIFVILVLNAVLGFIQEYKAEKAIEELKKLASLKATVLRDGKEKDVDAEELVPGDVVLIETGDRIPADARIIEEHEMETQEAALTGESTPVAKEEDKLKSNLAVGDRVNCVFSGTVATKGRAKAVVMRTGMKTEIGNIAKMISAAEKEKTPLQKKLAKLGKFLTFLVIGVSITVFGAGMLRGMFTDGVNFILVKEMLIAAIALAVAAIPEGLPAVVTISLALGVRRMVSRNALVRKLPSVETLGATTVICTDKTGTLTHNQMTVKRIFVNDKVVKVEGSGYKPEGHFSDTKNIDKILEIGALCNDSKLVKEKKKWEVHGDPTEGALIVSAKKSGMNVEEIEEKKEREEEIGFTSERKRMTTIHSTGNGKVAYMKGAPDVILDLCNKVLINGKVKKLTKKRRKKILDKNEEFADDALRVLGFAYKKVGKKYDKKNLEKNFIFVGLQGMIDPPRKEVKDAVKKCRSAGIDVIMVTGDHISTAKAIGKDLGIEGKSITGAELEKMSDKELKKKVEDIAVYARVDPKHKIRIVEALKSRKHIAAMTGDGVNDAPALKKADIGIAMGITGTDVSKEASDMVLTDDNFASIVNAVEEGRTIYDNIRKFVMYLLSSNLGEVLVVFFGILLGKLPILALHILWINIATDGLPALALGVEPPEKDIMKRKPRKKEEGIVTKKRFYLMMGIGVVMMLGTLGIFKFYPASSLEHSRTMAFTVLVLFQLFNVLNLQSEEKSVFKTLFMNKWLIGAVLSSVALQFVILYVGFFNTVFDTVALSFVDWIWAVGVAASILVFGELVKLGIWLKKR